ncbi:RNA pyrophosphohydrolase [uncultured archaeon]|nr:RNA pyrophosphohydrolase [uncultured archaeon]
MRKFFRKAVCIVVYKKDKDKIEYLLLKRSKHWVGWEFPKGGIDEGETKKEAAIREVCEETGLEIRKLNSHSMKGKYLYPKVFKDRPDIIGQTYKLFSAEVIDGKIKIDKKESSGYKWFSFKEAIKKLTWPDQKKCLKYVNKKVVK